MTFINTPKGIIELRELTDVQEIEDAEALQRKVWGLDVYPHPKELLIPAQHEGGFLAGAFTPDKELVGLVFSFPTNDPEVQHSQLLATLSEWRGLGIGAQLKWFQREWCLAHGITRLRWTVDPLRVANAELNFRHLGGIAHVYFPNYYGSMHGIDAGAPSDRLLVEWVLTSPRVLIRSKELAPDDGIPEARAVNFIKDGHPIDLGGKIEGPIKILLPEDFINLSHVNIDLAVEWRFHIRKLLTLYFQSGYAIKEFSRISGPAYILIHKDDPDE